MIEIITKQWTVTIKNRLNYHHNHKCFVATLGILKQKYDFTIWIFFIQIERKREFKDVKNLDLYIENYYSKNRTNYKMWGY